MSTPNWVDSPVTEEKLVVVELALSMKLLLVVLQVQPELYCSAVVAAW